MLKKTFLFIFYFIILIVVITQIINEIKQGEQKRLLKEVEDYRSSFKNVNISEIIPGYTPSKVIPFWFWNGNLTKKEITRQIELMDSSGIKEVIIHARSGLVQEYLSNEWFEIVDYAIKELKNKTMKVWIYDEFDWPSGRAGGKVLKETPGLVSKNLKMIIAQSSKFSLEKDIFNTSKIVSVINTNIDNISNLKDRYCSDLKCDFNDDFKKESVYIFYQDYGHFQTEYSKEYYVDLMNKPL